MEHSESDKGHNKEKAEHQVGKKHVLIEVVLVRLVLHPFEGGDAGKVGCVCAEQCNEGEDKI